MALNTLRKFASIIVGTVCLVAASCPAGAAINWHWEDDFSSGEKRKLRLWIKQVTFAVERQFGPYPFDIQLYFYRREGRGEPVPWANTRRSGEQGINLHVDPAYPLEAFLSDWTAPHELSHLLIPYVGREYSWFAEGFASYMQYQVMVAMGILSGAEKQQRYRSRMEHASRNFQRLISAPDESFAHAARHLRRERQYPTMYWGGAIYFLAVDRVLQARRSSLQTVLQEYLACCRLHDDSIDTLVSELDRIAGWPVFSHQLGLMKSRAGFPKFDHLL